MHNQVNPAEVPLSMAQTSTCFSRAVMLVVCEGTKSLYED